MTMQRPREREMIKQWTKRTHPHIDSIAKYCILLYREALEERRRKKRITASRSVSSQKT